MPKVQSSKDTVYYRHGAWGTMRLNSFDYRVIKSGYFSNQIFIAAKLMRCSHTFGNELPDMARIQIVPMYSMEQEEDGAFVKNYIRKSNNVHCLVMAKNAVDELLRITQVPVKKHSVAAYVPRTEAAVPVQGDKKDDSYQVINIFPTSTVVAIRQEREIFVLTNGRRLQRRVGKPSSSDISPSKREKTTVIDLDKGPRPLTIKLHQLSQTEFLERGKSGLHRRQDPEVSRASGTGAGPSKVQKVISSMPPLTQPTRNPVVTRSRAKLRKVAPINPVEVIDISDDEDDLPVPTNAPPVIIRKEKPSQRKSVKNQSDCGGWIDVTQFKTRYPAERKTIRYARSENVVTLSPSPKRVRLEPTKFEIIEEDPLFIGDTETEKVEENAVSASRDPDRPQSHNSPICRGTDINGSNVYSVYSFDFSTKLTAEHAEDRLAEVQRHREQVEEKEQEEVVVSCPPVCPPRSIDPRNCVRERKPGLNVRIDNDIDECNPLTRFVRTFTHEAQFFDDWLSKSASRRRVMPE